MGKHKSQCGILLGSFCCSCIVEAHRILLELETGKSHEIVH